MKNLIILSVCRDSLQLRPRPVCDCLPRCVHVVISEDQPACCNAISIYFNPGHLCWPPHLLLTLYSNVKKNVYNQTVRVLLCFYFWGGCSFLFFLLGGWVLRARYRLRFFVVVFVVVVVFSFYLFCFFVFFPLICSVMQKMSSVLCIACSGLALTAEPACRAGVVSVLMSMYL